jgi:arylsulfatase A-like enzyme
MPHVQAMQRDGMTFKDFFVTDSLCCPSRSSIFTGDFPHDTGVFSNFGPDGGFQTFYDRGNERRTFARALRGTGYLTAMMGKYLNGYMEDPATAPAGGGTRLPPTYVPRGWSEWDVAGPAYAEFNYTLNENGRLRRYGSQPSDYLTDVLARKGATFIDRAARRRRPFFLELATFAPHYPYVPAPRDENAFPGLRAPRPPSFNVLPNDPPRWLSRNSPLTSDQQAQIDAAVGKRAQSVRAVDALIARIQAALRQHRLSRNTYIVFSSDNGLHAGHYRLLPGKLTAFDTDIRVPLVVTGPAVRAASYSNAMAENIDLAKTFAAMGGTQRPSDGHSLLPLLHGQAPSDWRNVVLIEHRERLQAGVDPDLQPASSGKPPSYAAIRSPDLLYVEYVTGEREVYDLRRDPYELHNLAPVLSSDRPSVMVLLHRALRSLRRCHGASRCWAAAHLNPAIPQLLR